MRRVHAHRGAAIKRFVNLAVGVLGLIAVALISAFVTMRLAIHGREAVVPPLTGLAVSQATGAVATQGLHLTIENRFYSADVPAGHVIAQDPPAGFRVRRDWPVRITESLGSQRVAAPNLVGQSERAAMIAIHQLGLEPGAVVHMEAPGDPDVVIAQTPGADAGEMMSPRVSLLVSDPQSAEAQSYVMPSLVGLTYAAAVLRADGAGLRLVAEQGNIAPVQAASGTAPGSAAVSQPTAPSTVAIGTNGALPSEPPAGSIVVAQIPAAGHRVEQGSILHVTLAPSLP